MHAHYSRFYALCWSSPNSLNTMAPQQRGKFLFRAFQPAELHAGERSGEAPETTILQSLGVNYSDPVPAILCYVPAAKMIDVMHKVDDTYGQHIWLTNSAPPKVANLGSASLNCLHHPILASWSAAVIRELRC